MEEGDIEIKEEFFSQDEEDTDTEYAVDIKRLKEGEVIHVWNSFQGEQESSKDEENFGSYKCAFCWRQFVNSKLLKVHLRSHEKPKSSYIEPKDVQRKVYRCAVCEANFSRSNHLQVHMRRHTGERPYSCEICQARFARSPNLTIHMRTHTGERPYTCEFCEATFVRSTYLRSHIRTHTGERPYTCEFCDSNYSTKSILNRHLKNIHFKDIPQRHKVYEAI